MSNLPFGFSNSDDDSDPDKGPGQGGQGDPCGFGAQGFDPAALGRVLTQFGQMLSGMGNSMGSGGSAGPVNYDVAKQLAKQQLGTVTPIAEGTGSAVADAAHLAEL